MANRKKTPPSTEAAVLAKCRRKCCVCFAVRNDDAEKKGQIAHLDHSPANFAEENVAFLCFEHHDAYDSTTSQSKNFTIDEVKQYRVVLHAAIEAEDRKRGGIDQTGKALEEVVKLYTNVVADREKLIADLKTELARQQETMAKLAASVQREEEKVRVGHLKISEVNSTHDPGPIVQVFQQRAARSARLLLVEHHPDTANAMKRLLEARGYRVDATSDVVQGREMVRTDSGKRYDVIVTETSYDAAVAELVRIARQRGTACIALTGHNFPDRRQWATEVGFAAFIGKPATADEVDATIQHVLKKERSAVIGIVGVDLDDL